MVRAHVTRNQFNAYLEHATNTEHASLIILLPPANTCGQRLATEKHVRHGAHITGNQFNAYLEHAANTEHASLIIHTPQHTSTFGAQGLATEKHVKHGARTLQETNSTLT